MNSTRRRRLLPGCHQSTHSLAPASTCNADGRSRVQPWALAPLPAGGECAMGNPQASCHSNITLSTLWICDKSIHHQAPDLQHHHTPDETTARTPGTVTYLHTASPPARVAIRTHSPAHPHPTNTRTSRHMHPNTHYRRHTLKLIICIQLRRSSRSRVAALREEVAGLEQEVAQGKAQLAKLADAVADAER
jgi:hypothetical protein